ncbi:glutaminase A [Sphingomonas corticis]|jgi:glutaminase|uniref:Glutaminase n=1 Tax=Sphingomonas corticis TaxID=2722791 RepID=A0ABX1CVQ5_9SPHN|nr:glutaminase A [Sphingomonas corticis]NJR79982.1 glutaminase A [Sphingomonas corticis]
MDLSGILADIAADIDREAEAIEQAADAKRDDVAPGPFGIAVATAAGEVVTAGAQHPFPIQSISKVFALDLALRALEDRVFERVGREPSGDPFNSLVDLERTHGLPRNPFINAGALVVVDMLVERHGAEARDAVIALVRDQIGADVPLDEEVLSQGGDLNRAMLSFMRHHGNVRSASDEVMDAYARQCAVSVDVAGLARAGRFLLPTRVASDDAVQDCRARQNRTVLALMMTCGHYDASGDFAVRVGLPAKSGVGGGILAIAPQTASIAVWSPNLDQNGNSILGVRALEMLVARTGWSVFGPPLGEG